MTFLPSTLESFPGTMPLSESTATVLQKASQLSARLGCTQQPLPGTEADWWLPPCQRGAPAGLPEWPCVLWALGHRSSHQPCTLLRVFPPRRTFSLFSQFFGHWPHIHPCNFFYVSSPQRIMEQGQANLAESPRTGFPNIFSFLPTSFNLHTSNQLSMSKA